jgi:hypothetical protein
MRRGDATTMTDSTLHVRAKCLPMVASSHHHGRADGERPSALSRSEGDDDVRVNEDHRLRADGTHAAARDRTAGVATRRSRNFRNRKKRSTWTTIC